MSQFNPETVGSMIELSLTVDRVLFCGEGPSRFHSKCEFRVGLAPHVADYLSKSRCQFDESTRETFSWANGTVINLCETNTKGVWLLISHPIKVV